MTGYKPQKVYNQVKKIERLLYAQQVWHTLSEAQQGLILDQMDQRMER